LLFRGRAIKTRQSDPSRVAGRLGVGAAPSRPASAPFSGGAFAGAVVGGADVIFGGGAPANTAYFVGNADGSSGRINVYTVDLTSGVLFTGDVMMPYLGAPFFAEGSPDGLLEAIALIAGINPRTLVHGHTTLTELFTVDAVPGLLAALTELRDRSLAGIGRGLTLTGLVSANVLPEVLCEHPAHLPASARYDDPQRTHSRETTRAHQLEFNPAE